MYITYNFIFINDNVITLFAFYNLDLPTNLDGPSMANVFTITFSLPSPVCMIDNVVIARVWRNYTRVR